MGILMKQVKIKNDGVTLIELMITMAIFLILSGVMYSSFSYLTSYISQTNEIQSLNNKGQKILDYISEDIKMAGFLIGPDARIPICVSSTPSFPNVLEHSRNGAYDSLSIITAEPVQLEQTDSCMNGQKDCAGNVRKDYALTTRCNASSGGNAIGVDATSTCYDGMIVPVSGNKNAKSLITFETLAPTASAVSGEAPRVYFTVSSTGESLTIQESLPQEIPDNSTVFTLRKYTYDVDVQNGVRNLRRWGLNKDCGTKGEIATIVETNNLNTAAGGIDGLRFEFIYEKPISGNPSFPCTNIPNTNLMSCSTIPTTNSNDWSLLPFRQLKAIRVWLLLRSDKADRNYIDSKTYVLGNASSVTLGPFNDNYRRLLLTRAIEVKNLAYRAE